ncbi:diguanylate cyclase [Marinobacterium iners]|uniref:diguanylate cyclase n=1 Tax=Marinobacterium iners TaxID=48076 RepID=UPI001A8FAFCF|nr:diguanylate cyclase [Marinobacterium iners]QSR33811.1 diguanylate cyclase [Marinobacterium iners]
MPRFSTEQLCTEWTAINQRFSAEVQQFVIDFSQQHASSLSEHFYREMLGDPTASQFLSNDEVQSRLGQSMRRWVAGLFVSTTEDDVLRLIAEQRKIGEVHARIGIPVHLVLRGARCLKDRFVQLLHEVPNLPDEDQYAAMRLASDTIDLTMEVMGHAYSLSHDRNSRSEEAYRLFAITQNIASEKEQQRAALFDWENQLMFSQAVGTQLSELPRIQSSDFGLWFRHKGIHAFEGSAEAGAVMDTMEEIDSVLLPLFGSDGSNTIAISQDSRVHLLRDLRDKVKSIRFHLSNLFERNDELESGRDVLTRLLNRKFMPVVLSKQVSQSRTQKTAFAVLAIDIDHFKQVNDIHGHQAGDSVLQQLALILLNNSRSGDYLFRLGGEEFLLIAVDMDATRARTVAEKLRKSVERESFLLYDGKELKATISVGVACFDGHPDYQRVLRKADDALYQAKNSGRNRVVVAMGGGASEVD